MKRVWLLAAVATVFAASAGSEIHKWIDKDGNVHYSDSLPSGVDTELIKPPPTPSKGDILRTQVRTDLLIEQQKASRDQRAQEREESKNNRVQVWVDGKRVPERHKMKELCISSIQAGLIGQGLRQSEIEEIVAETCDP